MSLEHDQGKINFIDAPTLTGEGFIMRAWRAADIDPFAEMCADPEIMTYLGDVMDREAVVAYMAQLQDRFRRFGFFYWAVETPSAPFAGFVGLSRPSIETFFTPCVEVGWRLAKSQWGKGVATKAARLALEFGFKNNPELNEIVAMASLGNKASLAVMERLGMSRDPNEDFDYPGLDPAWPHRRCALYRIGRAQFMAQEQ